MYQSCVAITRSYSDVILLTYPRHRLLQASGLFASLGLGIVVMAPSLPGSIGVCILGYAITGIGNSVVAPIIISAAGSSIKDMKPTKAIAFVTSASLVGIMIGPSLIGCMSGVLGQLRWSFLLEASLLFQMTLIATNLGRLEE